MKLKWPSWLKRRSVDPRELDLQYPKSMTEPRSVAKIKKPIFIVRLFKRGRRLIETRLDNVEDASNVILDMHKETKITHFEVDKKEWWQFWK